MTEGKERLIPARVAWGWRQSVQALSALARAVDLPFISAVFVGTRLLLILATWLGAPLSHPTFLTHPTLHPFYHTWHHWDALHYAAIALHGYTPADVKQSPAFFPLFPLLERVALPLVGGDIALAGLLIANLAWLGALLELAALARRDVGLVGSRGAVLALSAFPTAFFGFVAYPEGLFLFLAIAAFRRMRGGQWGAAAALGLLAALTRQAGALLILPYLWEFGQRHGWSWRIFRADLLAGLAIPGGMALYALVLWRAVGDPLAFLHAQATWHRSWAWPPVTLWHGFLEIFFQPTRYFTFRAWQEFYTVVGMLALAVLAIRRAPGAYVAFAVPTLLLFLAQPASDWPLLSQSRFALELFPLFIMLGTWLTAAPWRLKLYCAVCLPTQLAFIIIFSHAGWII